MMKGVGTLSLLWTKFQELRRFLQETSDTSGQLRALTLEREDTFVTVRKEALSPPWPFVDIKDAFFSPSTRHSCSCYDEKTRISFVFSCPSSSFEDANATCTPYLRRIVRSGKFVRATRTHPSCWPCLPRPPIHLHASWADRANNRSPLQALTMLLRDTPVYPACVVSALGLSWMHSRSVFPGQILLDADEKKVVFAHADDASSTKLPR